MSMWAFVIQCIFEFFQNKKIKRIKKNTMKSLQSWFCKTPFSTFGSLGSGKRDSVLDSRSPISEQLHIGLILLMENHLQISLWEGRRGIIQLIPPPCSSFLSLSDHEPSPPRSLHFESRGIKFYHTLPSMLLLPTNSKLFPFLSRFNSQLTVTMTLTPPPCLNLW